MPTNRIPFTHAGGSSGAGHLLRVPVAVNGRETTFIFDTGIGITLIDERLAREWGLLTEGTHTGKRMSGQSVKVPLAVVPSIAVGDLLLSDQQVGIWDMGSFLPQTAEFDGIEGFLSLNAFQAHPVTLDYASGLLTIEDKSGLEARLRAGTVLPMEVRRDGPSVTIFFDISLPNDDIAHVEIDLGGGRLTLHRRYMPALGVAPGADGVAEVSQTDETGFGYVRYFTDLDGPIAAAAAPQFRQTPVPVMFQDIIYDGLIGDEFLRQFTVTFDLENQRLILADQ